MNCTFLTERSETQSQKSGLIRFGPVSHECKNLSEALKFGTVSNSAEVWIDLSSVENIDKICLSINASVNNVQTVVVEGIYIDSGMFSKFFLETIVINIAFLSL